MFNHRAGKLSLAASLAALFEVAGAAAVSAESDAGVNTSGGTGVLLLLLLVLFLALLLSWWERDRQRRSEISQAASEKRSDSDKKAA
jgi:hypothetical protein